MQCRFEMFADKIGKNTSVSYYRWEYGFYIWSLQMFFAFSSAKYLHFPILSASGGLWEIMLDVQPGWSSLRICWAVALWLSLLHICIGVSISPPVTHELILQWEILVFCSCSSWHELQVSIRTWAVLLSWYLNTSSPAVTACACGTSASAQWWRQLDFSSEFLIRPCWRLSKLNPAFSLTRPLPSRNDL